MAVFGSSEPAPGEPLYEQARELGRGLATAGHAVLNGGYGGVMEGASHGAVEAGGRVVGVTCRIFTERRPNRYVTEEVETADLHERTRRLIELADAFVVLGGKSGTLSELAFLWALDRAGCLGPRPVLVFSVPWGELVELLFERGLLDPEQQTRTRIVATPQEAVRALERALGSQER